MNLFTIEELMSLAMKKMTESEVHVRDKNSVVNLSRRHLNTIV